MYTRTCVHIHTQEQNHAQHLARVWPEPYIYTVYDRIFGDFPAKSTVIYTVYIWLWPTLHMARYITPEVGQNHIYMYGVYTQGWPERYIYTVYLVISLPKTPYIHRIYMVLANPIYTVFLAGKPPNIRSYTVHIYGSGQP
jgi:hypothetical protein